MRDTTSTSGRFDSNSALLRIHNIENDCAFPSFNIVGQYAYKDNCIKKLKWKYLDNCELIACLTLKGISNNFLVTDRRDDAYMTQNIRIIGIPDTCRADRRQHNAEKAKCASVGIAGFH